MLSTYNTSKRESNRRYSTSERGRETYRKYKEKNREKIIEKQRLYHEKRRRERGSPNRRQFNEEKKQFVEMYNKGLTYKEMAVILHVSMPTLVSWCKLFGLPSRRKGRPPMNYTSIMQIDGVTFAKDPRYDEYMKKAVERADEIKDANDKGYRIRSSRGYHDLIKKASTYLRVMKIKPLEEYGEM